MRQYRDGAVFVRAVTDKVGVDGFNAVWTSPGDAAAAGGDPAARGCGSGASTADRTPTPRRRRHPGRRPRRAGRPLPAGALVLVACSGGADSLALAAATAFEAPRAGLRAGALVVDHGLQADSADVAAKAAAGCRRPRPGPGRGAGRDGACRGGRRPEAAARTARYAALRGRRGRGSAPGGAARAHPGRPGRAGAAGPRPRLRRPVARRDAAPSRPVRAPAAGPGAGPPPRRRAGPRGSTRGRTRTTTTRPTAGSAPVACWSRLETRPRPGRRPRPSPARPTCCATDADLLDRLAGEARAALGRRGRWTPPRSPRCPDAVRSPGAGGCSRSRRACPPVRCSPSTSTRSTPWSVPAGTGRARWTCPGGLRARARGWAGADRAPRVRFNRSVRGPARTPAPCQEILWTPPIWETDLERVLITEEQIHARLDELATQIGRTTRARTSCSSASSRVR